MSVMLPLDFSLPAVTGAPAITLFRRGLFGPTVTLSRILRAILSRKSYS